MKKLIANILTLIVLLTIVSCKDNTFDLNYDAPLSIEFTGVDNTNIVVVDKGVMSYNAKIEVNAPVTGIKYFEIYSADVLTGTKGSLIDGTSQAFDDGNGNGVSSFSYEFTVENLTENKCVKVVATDGDGNIFERNLLVQITPDVLFSQSVKIETVEDYYGPYFASWLNGRVYMRRNGEAYKDEVDFSLGEVVIASEGTDTIPALVNPAERANYGLLTMNGLLSTKFELTTLTKAEYDAIIQTDASPVTSLPDPQLDAVKLVSGKVYLFKTANGKKGLIYVASLASKTGTIENVNGEWIENTSYHQATITTKTVQE